MIGDRVGIDEAPGRRFVSRINAGANRIREGQHQSYGGWRGRHGSGSPRENLRGRGGWSRWQECPQRANTQKEEGRGNMGAGKQQEEEIKGKMKISDGEQKEDGKQQKWTS